MSVHLKENYI